MKKSIKLLYVAIFTSISTLIFGFVLVRSVFYDPADEINLPSNEKNLVQSDEEIGESKNYDLFPISLNIPSIAVEAKVQYVGITKSGNMATPNNFKDVGWFKYGTIPGENGSAVIAGHVDNGLAFPGVFSKLKNVKIGDDIYIKNAGGDTVHFKIASTKIYDYDAPTQEIFNPKTDGAILNLITCAGVWVEKYGTHNKRLVVTAIKVQN